MSTASAARKSLLTTNSGRTHVLTASGLEHQSRILCVFLYSISHFFGDIRKIFSRVIDRRHPGRIRYKVGDLALATILMFIGRLGCGGRSHFGCATAYPVTEEKYDGKLRTRASMFRRMGFTA